MPGHIEIMVTSSSIKISNPGGLVEEVQHRVEQSSIELKFAAAAEDQRLPQPCIGRPFLWQWRDG